MTAAPAIRFEGTARMGGAPLFGPLGFEAAAGGWTCLLGPSGAGKTTVLRLVAGLDTGAEFEGTIAASDGRPLAGRIAWMAQSDLLLPWASVLDNVTLGARLRGARPDRDRARALLARVGLAAHAAKRPAELSGGERQRAALARTLMENRPVVLLDEPFSALDARTRAEMQELAAELLAGRTVILVTHDPAEAARLGSAILILSASGLEAAETLPPPLPRAVDDAEALALTGRLLARLRQAA